MIELFAIFDAIDRPVCHAPEAAAAAEADAREAAREAAGIDGCDCREFAPAPTTRRVVVVGCPRFEAGGVAAADTTCELAWRSIGCVGMHASSGDSTHSLPERERAPRVWGCGHMR